jgi:hypothetical protein
MCDLVEQYHVGDGVAALCRSHEYTPMPRAVWGNELYIE